MLGYRLQLVNQKEILLIENFKSTWKLFGGVWSNITTEGICWLPTELVLGCNFLGWKSPVLHDS